jgi:predicted kinase
VLRGGHPVIVDATFIRRDARQEFRMLAHSLDVPFFILRCDAEEDELRRRVRQRQRSGGDPSEADLEVLEQQLLVAQLPDARSEPETIAVETARSDVLEALLAEILRRLAADA